MTHVTLEMNLDEETYKQYNSLRKSQQKILSSLLSENLESFIKMAKVYKFDDRVKKIKELEKIIKYENSKSAISSDSNTEFESINIKQESLKRKIERSNSDFSDSKEELHPIKMENECCLNKEHSSETKKKTKKKEKKHCCSICGKYFYKPSQVKRHMLSHLKNKEFKCEYCNCKYGRKDSLMRHINENHI